MGTHLTLDIYCVSEEKCKNFEEIFYLLWNLPNKLGMKRLTTPYVVPVREEEMGDWGISAFVMIYESHISLHSWPEKGYVSMDVYSCGPLDTLFVVDYIKDFFQTTNIDTHIIKRGEQL